MSFRYVAFGARFVPATVVVTGNLTNAVLSLVDTISQNHPLMAGDAIPMGLSEIRK